MYPKFYLLYRVSLECVCNNPIESKNVDKAEKCILSRQSELRYLIQLEFNDMRTKEVGYSLLEMRLKNASFLGVASDAQRDMK